jgi:hypothetical protein
MLMTPSVGITPHLAFRSDLATASEAIDGSLNLDESVKLGSLVELQVLKVKMVLNVEFSIGDVQLDNDVELAASYRGVLNTTGPVISLAERMSRQVVFDHDFNAD